MPATLETPATGVVYPPLSLRGSVVRADAEAVVPTASHADQTDDLTRQRAEAYIALVHWLDRL